MISKFSVFSFYLNVFSFKFLPSSVSSPFLITVEEIKLVLEIIFFLFIFLIFVIELSSIELKNFNLIGAQYYLYII